MIDQAAKATDLDRRVEAFEAAWASGGVPNLIDFLPLSDDPDYLPVLVELVRVDMELRHNLGEVARLDRYRPAFPALFADPSRLRDVAFEEYRLRAMFGEQPHPQEYAVRYHVDTAGWQLPKTPKEP